jgi:hypothetical protein
MVVKQQPSCQHCGALAAAADLRRANHQLNTEAVESPHVLRSQAATD